MAKLQRRPTLKDKPVIHEETDRDKADPHRFPQNELNQEGYAKLIETLTYLRSIKPTEGGEEARRYAVTITDLEKVIAYFGFYVIKYP